MPVDPNAPVRISAFNWVPPFAQGQVRDLGISGSSVGDPDGLAGWHRIIAVNQTSVFLGTKLAAEEMAETSGRSIVNITSIMEFVGSTGGHPAYHASEGAVRIYF